MGIFIGKNSANEMPASAESEMTELPKQEQIGRKQVQEATKTLQKYKQGKSNLENRIVQDEQWYEMRHWEIIRHMKSKMPESNDKTVIEPTPEPSSAWLFNSLINKHADAMDNYPTPVVLPRERDDEESAKTLSSVLPVVMEYNDFKKTYDLNWWEKLKHGTACYGVFWNKDKENGLGDIEIRPIDLLNLFYEPGITDIQRSRNIFITELVDNDLLEQQYPELTGKLNGKTIDIKEYVYDDSVDTSNKSVVVDWYYKVKRGSVTQLHYVKYVGETVLYASENDPECAENGFYNHGRYPIVLDTLYPEKGTPIGFGYVAICKQPQLYIDKLSANIMQSSTMGTKKRFFVSNSTAVNEQEFMDWNKPLVHVEGEISDTRLQEINLSPVDGIYYNVLQSKIEEMKDTSANRDFNAGSTSSGVTAASAISALQESGNKVARDMIQSSYRTYTDVVWFCLELMRQFYDVTRSFRITGEVPGSYDFVDVNNMQIKEQVTGTDSAGNMLYRKPIFDLKIKAQKTSPFSRMEENERAKELYGLGFFDPNRAQESMGALEMMDFEGIDKVKEYVSQGQTLLGVVEQYSAQLDQMAAIIQGLTGKDMGLAQNAGVQQTQDQAPSGSGNSQLNRNVMAAQQPQQGYTQSLVNRSTPKMGEQ